MKKIISILLVIIIFATILPLNIIATYAASGDLIAHALADKILQENLVPEEHLELTTTDSKELAELTSCAKKIVSGLTTDYQKIEAVCKYVATNVYYDYDCYYGRTDYTYFTPYVSNWFCYYSFWMSYCLQDRVFAICIIYHYLSSFVWNSAFWHIWNCIFCFLIN